MAPAGRKGAQGDGKHVSGDKTKVQAGRAQRCLRQHRTFTGKKGPIQEDCGLGDRRFRESLESRGEELPQK